MFSIITIVIFVLVAALLIYAATLPDTFRVERSVEINAAPEKIFPFVNDFHNWRRWSPYEKIDPALKRIYSSNESGEGAVYEWEGNNKVGSGRMEIMTTVPPSSITIKLDFLKPFKAHHTALFTFDKKGDQTHVSWSNFGTNPYPAKLMCMFVDMDHMIGKDFEAGLVNLKNIAEK